MSVALVADAHLGGPGGSGEDLAAQLLELPERGCRRLVFLGDLFHVWVGDKRYETQEIRRLLPVIEQLRRSGVSVYYVEGNRDFFLPQSPYALAFDGLAREVRLEVGKKRYLMVHGDGLNDRDWRYLAWRGLSKSAPSRFLVTHVPHGVAHRIVHTTERRLARTNWKHKIAVPEAAIRRYAEQRLGEGFDVVLLGHFHEARSFALAGGEARVVPAWFQDRRILWL